MLMIDPFLNSYKVVKNASRMKMKFVDEMLDLTALISNKSS